MKFKITYATRPPAAATFTQTAEYTSREAVELEMGNIKETREALIVRDDDGISYVVSASDIFCIAISEVTE